MGHEANLNYDVVVCGGGPAGCAAALSARREGLSVLLAESSGQLGGMATGGLVSQLLGGRTQEGEWVVGGLFSSLVEEASAKGCALIPHLQPGHQYHPYGWFNWFIHGIPIDPFRMAAFLDGKMEEAGVDVLLFSKAMGTKCDGDRIRRIVLSCPEGPVTVSAAYVIDATGNADVAFESGCTVVKGRPQDGKLAPSSLIFHVYGVDEAELTAGIESAHDPKLRDLIAELRKEGVWDFPYDLFICTKLLEEGEFYVNTIRLTGIDGTDSHSLSAGMAEGRREVFRLMDILKARFPGFRNAKLKSVAPLPGIRETRRIKGDFVLGVEDLMRGESFDDTIGFSMYGWDLPDPDRPSVQPFASDDKSGFVPKVRKGLYTPLPYRTMIPDKVRNLLCAGRTVSVEGQVLGPVRVMAPCMATGEAAGAACALAARDDTAVDEVDWAELRSLLSARGAIVDKENLPEIHPRVDQ